MLWPFAASICGGRDTPVYPVGVVLAFLCAFGSAPVLWAEFLAYTNTCGHIMAPPGLGPPDRGAAELRVDGVLGSSGYSLGRLFFLRTDHQNWAVGMAHN